MSDFVIAYGATDKRHRLQGAGACIPSEVSLSSRKDAQYITLRKCMVLTSSHDVAHRLAQPAHGQIIQNPRETRTSKGAHTRNETR